MPVSFDDALAYAQSQWSAEAWVHMRPREQTAAIYAALRYLDLQAAQEGQSAKTPEITEHDDITTPSAATESQ